MRGLGSGFRVGGWGVGLQSLKGKPLVVALLVLKPSRGQSANLKQLVGGAQKAFLVIPNRIVIEYHQICHS